MKRKLAAGLVTTLMVATMAMPVAAADHSGTTDLITSKTSEYTLTIPASSKEITYGAVDTALGNLKVKGNVSVGETVSVSVQTNAFQRTGGSADDKIAFTLMDTTGTAKAYETTTWNETELRAESKAVPLSVNIPTATWNSAKAGEYTGSIVFTGALNTVD